jgi:DNA-binding transcriptional MerR regulator
MKKFYSISELSKNLNLIDPSSNKPLNHILRYWEKEFKQIKPKKINNRRYYSPEQVEIIKMIKFLLKTRGMTISGVKNAMNLNTKKLDVYKSDGLKAEYYKKHFILKSKNLLNKIRKLKKYGKKNPLKS